MKRVAMLFLAMTLALPAAAGPFDTAHVRDTGASFIDVPARMAYLRSAPANARLAAALPKEFDCRGTATVAPPTGRMVIPRRYLSGSHGPVDPEYERVVGLYRDFETTVASLSNLYVATGKAEYAACLVDFLDTWAKAGTYLDYDPVKESQSWYQTEWSMSSAGLALSLVRNAPGLDRAKLDGVLDWMGRVVAKQISYPGGEGSCCNNHSYWRGLQATIAGVNLGNDDLFRWGLGRYAQAIGEIAEDGSLPLEMARHELAIHYQNYAITPLVLIAETAARQGIDLYTHSVNGRTLADAIAFLLKALADPAIVARYASEKQELKAFAPGRGDLAWMEFHRARFGGTAFDQLLEKPVGHARTGGAATLLAYRP